MSLPPYLLLSFKVNRAVLSGDVQCNPIKWRSALEIFSLTQFGNSDRDGTSQFRKEGVDFERGVVNVCVEFVVTENVPVVVM